MLCFVFLLKCYALFSFKILFAPVLLNVRQGELRLCYLTRVVCLFRDNKLLKYSESNHRKLVCCGYRDFKVRLRNF